MDPSKNRETYYMVGFEAKKMKIKLYSHGKIEVIGSAQVRSTASIWYDVSLYIQDEELAIWHAKNGDALQPALEEV